ncbi:hypothetical protein [Microbacterium sp. 22242]|uniref:hypothetical protein n=1 Tax=Microbacterium sp. 22242 TaxID=3453896 RepID=UPI003F86DB66
MTDAADYSTGAQVRRITAEFTRRRTRLFLVFATAEGLAFVAAVLAVYVLGLTDPKSGVWIFAAIAIVGGGVLSTLLLTQIRAQQQAIRDVGGTPFPSAGR